MTLSALFQQTTGMPWVPASVLFGEKLLVDGQDVIFLKILSDRRAEGGGVAEITRFAPPAGKRIRIKAVSESDEHVYILEGGHDDGTGKQIRFPGDYLLHPKGLPHSAILSRETIALVIYAGEPDRVTEFRVELM
ncbi:MAG: hypothetical protein ACYCYP_10795 [Leptospirales bacterium]